MTGHHENCPRRPNALGKALELIMKLANGMECWAKDNGGIHPDAWEAYRQAKALEGVILPERMGSTNNQQKRGTLEM